MCDKQAIAQMRMHKTNLLLMAISICLHFSSLNICLEFAPPQENQE